MSATQTEYSAARQRVCRVTLHFRSGPQEGRMTAKKLASYGELRVFIQFSKDGKSVRVGRDVGVRLPKAVLEELGAMLALAIACK